LLDGSIDMQLYREAYRQTDENGRIDRRIQIGRAVDGVIHRWKDGQMDVQVDR